MKNLKQIVVNEARKDPGKDTAIRSVDNIIYNDVRQRYYGVADHLSELVRQVNLLNGETGEFGEDLKHAKAALKSFDKMVLGKYV